MLYPHEMKLPGRRVGPEEGVVLLEVSFLLKTGYQIESERPAT